MESDRSAWLDRVTVKELINAVSKGHQSSEPNSLVLSPRFTVSTIVSKDLIWYAFKHLEQVGCGGPQRPENASPLFCPIGLN